MVAAITALSTLNCPDSGMVIGKPRQRNEEVPIESTTSDASVWRTAISLPSETGQRAFDPHGSSTLTTASLAVADEKSRDLVSKYSSMVR